MATTPAHPVAAVDPATLDPSTLAFAFLSGRLLVLEEGETVTVPTARELPPARAAVRLGDLDGRPTAALVYAAEEQTPPNLKAYNLRDLFGRLEPAVAARAGRASQVVDWFLGHAFCGRCGSPTHPSTVELARKCTNCELPHYPRVTPAVIMLVERGESMLLARSANFRGPFFSALAGFVEPGETLEEAVAREVAEEVGLDVEGITYFGSQPWPFPSQLMIGFTATHTAGEIELRDSEIVEARWVGSQDELPMLPGRFSIARRLIDAFLAR